MYIFSFLCRLLEVQRHCFTMPVALVAPADGLLELCLEARVAQNIEHGFANDGMTGYEAGSLQGIDWYAAVGVHG